MDVAAARMALRLRLLELEEGGEPLDRLGRHLLAGGVGHLGEVRRLGVGMVEAGLGADYLAQPGLELVESLAGGAGRKKDV